jgi:hypothetical protein
LSQQQQIKHADPPEKKRKEKKREQLIKLLTVVVSIAAGPIRVQRRALIHTQNPKVSESYKFGEDNNVSQSYCLVSQLSSFHLRLSLFLAFSLSRLRPGFTVTKTTRRRQQQQQQVPRRPSTALFPPFLETL